MGNPRHTTTTNHKNISKPTPPHPLLSHPLPSHNLNIDSPHLLLMPNRQHIRQRLIRTHQVLLHTNMILNLQKDHRCRTQQAERQKSPIRRKLGYEASLAGIEGPRDSCAGGLNSLVETDVVGGAATGVGEGAHEPVGVVSLVYM